MGKKDTPQILTGTEPVKLGSDHTPYADRLNQSRRSFPGSKRPSPLENSSSEQHAAKKISTDALNDTEMDADDIQEPKDTRLSAIKLKIDDEKALFYSKNPMKLSNEILKIKGKGQNLKIKFSSFSKTHPSTIIIATDDKDTHKVLSSEWPADAFGCGATLITKQQKTKSFSLIVKGIDKDTKLISSSLFNFENQGIIKAERIENKSKQPTSIVRLTFSSEVHYNSALANGIRIGYTIKRPIPERTVIQCFKCQQFGHTAQKCTNETRCLKCGVDHESKSCSSATLYCANCRGNHAACSRSCPNLKKVEEERISRAWKTAANFPSVAPTLAQVLAKKQEEDAKEQTKRITAIVNSAIQQQMTAFVTSITTAITTVITSVFSQLQSSKQSLNLNELIRKSVSSALQPTSQTNPNPTKQIQQKTKQ